MSAFLETELEITDRFFEPAPIHVPQISIQTKTDELAIAAQSIDPLSFLPPGDFQFFSVPFGDFHLSFARREGRLWAYVDSGGPSLDKILAQENPQNRLAALVPVTEDGHGLLFLENENTKENPIITVQIEGRLLKVSLGQRGIFVADMGSLRPRRPDPLIMPPHEKAITYLAQFSEPSLVEVHNLQRTLQIGLSMDSFGPWMTAVTHNNGRVVMPQPNELCWTNIKHNGQCTLQIGAHTAHASILCNRITLLLDSGEAFFGRLPLLT